MRSEITRAEAAERCVAIIGTGIAEDDGVKTPESLRDARYWGSVATTRCPIRSHYAIYNTQPLRDVRHWGSVG